jgi:hypothetical protein
MIKHIIQPPESSLCGQTCVAKIAGITLEESIEAFAALRKLGIDCGDSPLTRLKGQDKPDTCIVKLHFEGTANTHWVVRHEERFYDPSVYGDSKLNKTKNKYPEGVRQTSYLPIFIETQAQCANLSSFCPNPCTTW